MRKKREIKSGIYKITNLINENIYIGSSMDLHRRIKKYKTQSLNVSKNIKESIQTYGIENHNFEIICEFEENEIDLQLLLDFEDYYILHFVKELGDSTILNSRCNKKNTWVNLYSNYNKFCKDNPHCKKINQFTKDNIFIKTWDSIIDIERELGINQSHIRKCCKKIKSYNTSGGFIWKYAEN